MSRKGNCWDNAPIEVFYDRQRRHSTDIPRGYASLRGINQRLIGLSTVRG